MSAVSPAPILPSSSTRARLMARRPTSSALTTSKPSFDSSDATASASFTAFISFGTVLSIIAEDESEPLRCLCRRGAKDERRDAGGDEAEAHCAPVTRYDRHAKTL